MLQILMMITCKMMSARNKIFWTIEKFSGHVLSRSLLPPGANDSLLHPCGAAAIAICGHITSVAVSTAQSKMASCAL